MLADERLMKELTRGLSERRELLDTQLEHVNNLKRVQEGDHVLINAVLQTCETMCLASQLRRVVCSV